MTNFADVQLKPEVLARYGLPDTAYPVASADLQSAQGGREALPLAKMLHGLQLRSSEGDAQWKHLEPAMHRLAELLAPDDGQNVVSVSRAGINRPGGVGIYRPGRRLPRSVPRGLRSVGHFAADFGARSGIFFGAGPTFGSR